MSRITQQWDAHLDPAVRERLDTALARRRFLLDACKAAASLPFIPGLALLSACSEDPQVLQNKLAKLEPWRTFAMVQAHLFPDDGNGPGATHINATAYLKFVLEAADTDEADRGFILDGVDWLNRLAIARHKGVFAGLITTQREALLIEVSRGDSATILNCCGSSRVSWPAWMIRAAMLAARCELGRDDTPRTENKVRPSTMTGDRSTASMPAWAASSDGTGEEVSDPAQAI